MDNYNELRNALMENNMGFKPPPVIDDVLNDKAIVGKSAIEGVGNMLTGTAIAKTISTMSKSRKVLENAGVASEDIDSIAEQAASGDLSSAAGGALRAGVRAVNQQLGNGIKYVKGVAQGLGRRAQAGLNVSDDLPSTWTEATRGVEDYIDPVNPNVGSLFDNLKGGRTAQDMILDADPEKDVSGLLGASDEVGAETSTALSAGEKAVEGLKDAAEASLASDVDPVDLVVTGALGLASVIGGLFIKTHHVKNVAPPQQIAQNYGVQIR